MGDATALLHWNGGPLAWTVVAWLGALWGSFATVCVHRIPRQKSIVRPGSSCPHCQQPLRWYHNIPILSWLLLRGTSACCGKPIGLRYVAIELSMVLLALVAYARFVYGQSEQTLQPLVMFVGVFFFSWTLLVLSWIDSAHFLLPNVMTIPGILVFFIVGQLLPGVMWYDALIGAAAGYGFVWMLATLYRLLTRREGIGYGDAKLLALIGAFLGWQALPTTLLFGSLLGTVAAIPLFWRARRLNDGTTLAKQAIPFGPFLAIGSLLHLWLFYGKHPIDVLLRWLGL